MDAKSFKKRADAIDQQAHERTAKAHEAFQRKREEVERWRRDELANLAEEFRQSMDEEDEDQETVSAPETASAAEAPPELPLSKSGRLKRGVLEEVLPKVAQELGEEFTKTALFKRTEEKYPNSPINRTSVNGVVDRLEEQGVMRKVREEPEQVFVVGESGVGGNDGELDYGRVLSMRE